MSRTSADQISVKRGFRVCFKELGLGVLGLFLFIWVVVFRNEFLLLLLQFLEVGGVLQGEHVGKRALLLLERKTHVLFVLLRVDLALVCGY